MKRYRIVKVPLPGKKSKYKVQVHVLETQGWWFYETKVWKWYELDSYGHAIYSPDEIFTPPLSLFDSIQQAKDYIKMRLEYLAKTEEVVFDTLTANPPTETGT